MITYSADFQERRLLDVFKAMLRGMARSRFVAYRLAMKDIKVEYSRSAMGIFWDFLDPFVLGVIFYFLAKVRVIDPGPMGMPYVIYVVYGLLIYQSFAEALLYAVDSIHRTRDLLTHQKLPPEAMILSVFYRVLFNSAIRIVIMLGFSLALYFSPRAPGIEALSFTGFFLFILAYPLIIFAGLAIGIFLSPFNAIYRDVGRLARIILNPLRYLTPTVFAFSATGWGERLMTFNPVSALIFDLRQLAVAGEIRHLPIDLAWISFYCIVFLVGWLVFHLAIPVLAERG